MEKDNTLLKIIEGNDTKAQEEENPAVKLKHALANKKLKENFFRDNEINKMTEIINDDFENEIDQSLLEMEETVGLTYDSESDEPHSSSNGNYNRRRTISSDDEGTSDEDDDTISAKNSRLIESSVLTRRKYDDYQQASSIMMPFYGRRRLSECKEESESEEEIETPAKPAIVVTSTNGKSELAQEAAPKKRFIVTKTEVLPVEVKQPVSILKKTPSPPSNQKLFMGSPKKIRYEASALKDISAQKNSQTIHFPCSSGVLERANVKNFFSPQGLLQPHLDRRYFDTSLVEVRGSQTLNDSSKSLDDRGSRLLDDNVWIKRHDPKQVNDKVSISSDSISGSNAVSCVFLPPISLQIHHETLFYLNI